MLYVHVCHQGNIRYNCDLKDLTFYTIKVVPLPEGFSKQRLIFMGVIMSSFPGVIKWSQEGLMGIF